MRESTAIFQQLLSIMTQKLESHQYKALLQKKQWKLTFLDSVILRASFSSFSSFSKLLASELSALLSRDLQFNNNQLNVEHNKWRTGKHCEKSPGLPGSNLAKPWLHIWRIFILVQNKSILSKRYMGIDAVIQFGHVGYEIGTYHYYLVLVHR